MATPRLKVTIIVEDSDASNRYIKIAQGIAIDTAVPDGKYELVEYAVEKIMVEVKKAMGSDG